MLEQLDELVESIKNNYLAQLLNNIFQDQQVRKDFITAPAGKLWHHNYIGGLLQHSLAVALTCDAVQARYQYIDRDLLITAALLHDIGKIRELQTNGFIDYSDEGRLTGHIVLGAHIVKKKIAEITDFPANLAVKLEHLILSHQGKLEHGSPVLPMMIEAIMLYYADELDSKANAFERIIAKEKGNKSNWSGYINLIERFVYVGDAK
jgi:3'-5' exoribonuclease